MRRRELTTILLGVTLLLGGCGGIALTPVPVLPKALVEPIKARVGVLLTPEQRNFTHRETRVGSEWTIQLGPAQERFSRDVFGALFTETQEFSALDTARSAPSLQAIFEPRIEQFSFATAQETGGNYVAVTIRKRIEVLAPNGEPHDSLTLTGYGTSAASGMSSGPPIEAAARAAMRDSAAKLLAQFPALTLAGELTSGQMLVGRPTPDGAQASSVTIDALPIRKSRRPLNLPSPTTQP